MIGLVLETAIRDLNAISDSAPLDAEVLLAHTLRIDRGNLRARYDQSISTADTQHFHHLISRRRQGEPLAYILGHREFWSLSFKVTPAVLVPRPESELLVQFGLDALTGIMQPRILDLGTGSGAIGLSLAYSLPHATVDAVDISPAALAVAEDNRRELGLSNVRTVLGNWFDAIRDETYDLIVSNPPYLADDDPHLATGHLAAEPQLALVSGKTGLEAYKLIAPQALGHLRTGGILLLEHGNTQASALRTILDECGYARTTIIRDLAGHERATRAHKPG
jgi:release factor glutamine methyltransferase